MSKRVETSKKIKRSLIVISLLILCLILSTFSLAVDKAYNINLNDGLPVIEEYTEKVSPGAIIEKNFFIENESSSKFDYKLYFENVDGSLGNIIKATFYDKDKVILSGFINELTKSNSSDATGSLNPNEKKYLKIVFTFPKKISNKYKNSTLMFDIKATTMWPS